MAKKHWGFFSVPHLLWHGSSVHNGHLREPVTLVIESSAVELSLPVFTTKVCRGWYSNIQPSAFKANALTHNATAAVPFYDELVRNLVVTPSTWHAFLQSIAPCISSILFKHNFLTHIIEIHVHVTQTPLNVWHNRPFSFVETLYSVYTGKTGILSNFSHYSFLHIDSKIQFFLVYILV